MIIRFDKFVSVCLLCGFCLVGQKSHAFDYGKYNKEHRQLRSLSSATTTTAVSASGTKNKEKSTVLKDFMQKVLTAMDSDTVPAKLFETNRNFSVYFKPAKISKLGITYKF